jgi:hypothetical protein
MAKSPALWVLTLASCGPETPSTSGTTSETGTSETRTSGTTDSGTPTETPRASGLYAFLAARQEPGTGLLESFVDNPQLPADFSSYLASNRPSFTYDNSLAALAWLARGTPDDLIRAEAVLAGLVSIQRSDGALPDVVHVQTLAPSPTASTGNQAWTMLALLAGHDVSGDERWLLAAERVADYLLDPSRALLNPFGFGGYRLTAGSTVVATEHNIDLTPAFARLAAKLPSAAGLRTASEVQAAAERARIFAESRFDPLTGLVFTGTDGGGILSNTDVVPLDTQSWSVLSLGRAQWRASYDWARQTAPTGLWVASPGCPGAAGPSFSDADVSELWTEGLGQMLVAARLLGDADGRAEMDASVDLIQSAAPNADGSGLVASCGTLPTGFGFDYYNSLAVGPTAWAALATLGVDPFWFQSVEGGLAAHPLADLPTVQLAVPAGQRYTCTGFLPCRFTATGTSSGVVGTTRKIFLLVQPTAPFDVGQFFTQAMPATVAADGSWSVSGQLGDGVSPVNVGDGLRLVALVVDGLAPTLVLPVVTPDTVPDLVATSGLLDATVQ